MKKYRIKKYTNPLTNYSCFLVQRRFLLVLWKTLSKGGNWYLEEGVWWADFNTLEEARLAIEKDKNYVEPTGPRIEIVQYL